MRDGRSRRAPEPLNATGSRFGLIVSRFNEDITTSLVEGACSSLLEQGASADAVDVIHVPGAWELIGATQRAVDSGRYHALVALGCIIRGKTPHFDFIAGATARGLSEVARLASVPVTFGVLTTDTPEQARARAGGTAGNKGSEAALAAVEMLDVHERLRNGLESA